MLSDPLSSTTTSLLLVLNPDFQTRSFTTINASEETSLIMTFRVISIPCHSEMPPRRKKKYSSRPEGVSRPEPSAPSQSWGRLIDDNWHPSPLYNRLVDSLFDFLDSTAPSPFTNSGQLEFEKLDRLQKMSEPGGWGNVPRAVAGWMMGAAWDHLGAAYTIAEDEDGYKFPTLNKENFRIAELEGSKIDPDEEYQEWVERFQAATLIDPSTHTQFIGPIPRSAFPEKAFLGAKEAFDNMLADAMSAITSPHTTEHSEFYTLLTSSGSVFCDACTRPILGRRYTCKDCFDYNECDTCFVAATPHLEPESKQ